MYFRHNMHSMCYIYGQTLEAGGCRKKTPVTKIKVQIFAILLTETKFYTTTEKLITLTAFDV